MLSYYYDINSAYLYDSLFKNTYVYEHPTSEKNSYYILRFDFSGASANNIKDLEESFNKIVRVSINEFIKKYKLDIQVTDASKAADYIREFLSLFAGLELENRIYIIVDEYDNFANSVLNENIDKFKDITGNESFLKNFYAEIKKRVFDGVIKRVYITGVCSITLDSLNSGFNITTNITNDFRFNAMVGLTHSEVKALVENVENNKEKQKEIYNTLVEYFDGYLFNEELPSNDKVFNSTLVINFLSYYNDTKMYPKNMIDSNVASGYSTIESLLTLKSNDLYKEIITDILDNNSVTGNIITNFDLGKEITHDDIISLLYYFGYLSIDTSSTRGIQFRIPNKVIMDLYADYFRSVLDKQISLKNDVLLDAMDEVIFEGKIDKITNYVSEILTLSENRIFQKFDEKYIQMMYFTLLNKNSNYSLSNEYFANGGYIDLYIKSKNEYCKYDLLIELKYIKKEEYNEALLENKFNEAKEQIEKYIKDTRINTSKLKKYVVVFSKNEVKLLKEV